MRRASPAHEEIVALNRSRMPKRLSAVQLDSQDGSLDWPAVLRRPQFEGLRSQLDRLFAERALRPYEAGLGSPNYHQIEHLTREFRQRLQAKVHKLSADDFINGNKFLKSLAYEARFGLDSETAESTRYAPSGVVQ
jgi:hypothetical protein